MCLWVTCHPEAPLGTKQWNEKGLVQRTKLTTQERECMIYSNASGTPTLPLTVQPTQPASAKEECGKQNKVVIVLHLHILTVSWPSRPISEVRDQACRENPNCLRNAGRHWELCFLSWVREPGLRPSQGSSACHSLYCGLSCVPQKDTWKL